jgi:hypothetical protein
MSDASTTRMLDAYIEQRQSVPMFLSSFFKTTPRSFHNSEYVEVDIRRAEPYLAIPVQSVESGTRKHEASVYTNKKHKPPVYDMETSISAYTASKRQPGVNPFQDPNFRAAALSEAFVNLGELEDMIRRAVELQASQIFQTGVISLKDATGAEIFGLDFGMRPTHLVTTTAWAADGSTGDPFTDIENLGIELRRHGKLPATDLIFGKTAMQRFRVNTKVNTQLDNLAKQRWQDLAPVTRPGGATYYGTIAIGHYNYRLWMYDGFYIDPETLEATPYVGDANVIMLAEQGQRVLTFGSIPMFIPPDARAMQFLPTRLSSVEQGFDLSTNVWVTPDGKHLKLSAGTRPLCVPTALDTFGCLTVA